MMVSREEVLNKLPEYRGEFVLIKQNQDVYDIIREVLKSHQRNKRQYDKIAGLFYDPDTEMICDNIRSFIKKNVKYIEEPEEKQTSKLPAATIIEGGDCKHMSSMAAGILSGLNRMGCNIDYCYRFASYKLLDKEPHHVFVVVNDNGNEIYIDPVPGSENKEPIWILDKKIKDMAVLRNIAGVEVAETAFDSEESLPYYYNGAWHFPGNENTVGSVFNDLFNVGTSAADTSLSVATGGLLPSGGGGNGIISTIIKGISSLFGGGSVPAQEKIWKMFPLMADSTPQDVYNQLVGIEQHMAADKPYDSNWQEAFANILNKYGQIYASANGFTITPVSPSSVQPQNAAQLFKQVTTPAGSFSNTGGNIPGTSSISTATNFLTKNPLLIAGIGIAAILLLSNKKRKVSGKENYLPIILIGGIAGYFLLKKKNTNSITPDSLVIPSAGNIKTLPEVVISQNMPDTPKNDESPGIDYLGIDRNNYSDIIDYKTHDLLMSPQ